MPDHSPRRLLAALAASLLLHAALLSGGDAGGRARLASSSVIKARLVAGPAREPVPTPQARVAGKASQPAPTAGIAAQSRALRPESVGKGSVKPPPAASVRQPAGAGGAGGGAEDTGQDGVDADALRQYRMSVAVAARRLARPPEARDERGGQGTVAIALDFGVPDTYPAVTVLRSSGNEVLDTQALEMLTRAVQATPLPDRLSARGLRLVLSVRFGNEADQ